MSPLKEGNNVYPDKEERPVNWWSQILGISAQTIPSALARSGIHPKVGEPRHPNQPNQRLISIRDFPQLIRGFQLTGIRPDGFTFHN